MIMARQEVQDGIERISPNFSYFFLGDLGESQSCGALEVDVVREG